MAQNRFSSHICHWMQPFLMERVRGGRDFYVSLRVMARHNDLGRWGENLACERLVAAGYAIAARNWRSGHYEIDIIAMKGNHVAFCEVKTRSDCECDPLEAVDQRKISRMIASAREYMEQKGLDRHTVQFDLFGITVGADGTPSVEHIPDAFEIPLSTC